ncbi:transmembrane protein 104 [Lates japonicus]|nr:transmembrane protein 104 [Lates japonicus]
MRPVKNWTSSTLVELDMLMYGILGVDEKTQTVTSHIWVQMRWRNEFLTWNPSDFCEIYMLTVPRSKLWIPDVDIREDASDTGSVQQSPLVSLYPNGFVYANGRKRLTFTCQLNLFKFPFDTQNCNITFSSANYDVFNIILGTVQSDTTLSLLSERVMITQGEWQLIKLETINQTSAKYNQPESELIYRVTIMRKPMLYVINLIVPLLYFLILDLASFFISEARGEKLGFKVTVLLSISVLLLILQDMLPSTEDTLPMIANYCVGVFALVGISILEAMLICFLMDLDGQWSKKVEKSVNTHVEIQLETNCHKEPAGAEGRGQVSPVKSHLPVDCPRDHDLLRLILEEVKAARQEAGRKDEKKKKPGRYERLALIIDSVFFALYLLTIIVFLVFIKIHWKQVRLRPVSSTMAGGITETGEPYSAFVGLVYMFNLIVGTGALTMPKAFATAGWVVSLALISFLGFMSYMTTTFVIEAMAAANAQLRWKRREQEEIDDSDSTSEYSDDDVMGRGRSEPETKPILSVQRSGGHVDHFDIVERVEMGQMASMFFNKVGVNMFYICIIVYLYGDLAIYAAAVPISLMEVACGNHSCSAGSVKYNDTDPCWGSVTRKDAYRVFLSVFTVLLGPFTFFNAQKTKYLQILTSFMRWIAFTMMIILALIRIGKGTGEGRPPVASLSGIPNLFGVCVYSFMCQHSLPSLVTPISDKKRVGTLVLADYILILGFYVLLSFTAIFCFNGSFLHDMYTLNFTDNCDVLDIPVLRYFLGLFPVFTISTNFPIIAVTLRNNWKTLFHRDGGTYPWVVDRVVFPLITLVPPILVAFCTHNLESLVGITGSYAGTGIQYIIPAFLVYYARRHLEPVMGRDAINKHQSPFRHAFWVWFVLLWAAFCLMFVTANIILTDTRK